MDLNLLIALKTLLQERNVTRAGTNLHVTQSAMSGILARLREFFDDPLLVQVGRKTELTPLAESLVQPINDILIRIDAALATRPHFDASAMRRHVSIVASDYVQSVLFIDLLRELQSEAPGLTIEFRQPSPNSPAELESGDVDFVINPESFVSPHHHCEPLFDDTYTIVCDRDNGGYGERIELDAYLDAEHVAFRNSQRNEPLFETWFARNYPRARRVEVTTHTFGLLPHMLLGTRRIATMQTRMASLYAKHLPIRLIAPSFDTPRLTEAIQWHTSRDADPGTGWLRRKIAEAARGLPPV
ncbi:LysR family transcriptional regulator [Burkholderia multivorans]|uniref:LysR family transcriptional regulator n=1 Tax=Burkholderia multivorans TaxID=87883 RepID=UPI0015920966|nr:LysR family transcriptional regulator [Burkholderia multivorans]